jgi:hypothetical protein
MTIDSKQAFDLLKGELKTIREDTAQIRWVEAIVKPIENSQQEIKQILEKTRDHKCQKETILTYLNETVVMIREEISNWKFFKSVLIGAIGTLLSLGVGAVIAFITIQNDLKNQIKENEDQAKRIKKIESYFSTNYSERLEILSNLKSIQTGLLELKKQKDVKVKNK